MYERGKVNINGIEFQFILIEDKLEIILNDMNDCKEISNVHYDDGMYIYHGNECLNDNHITGYGADGLKYEFYISFSYFTLQKSFMCDVRYYILYNNFIKKDNEKKRLIFTSKEIDGMANYGQLYTHKYDSPMKLDGISLEPFRNTNLEYHKFSVDKKDYSLYFVDGYTANSNSKIPIEFKNYLYLEVSDINGISDYYENYAYIRNMLSFLYHRRNIGFNEIKIQSYNGKSFFDLGKFIVFDKRVYAEEIKKNKTIKYNEISSILNNLAKQVFSKKIHLDHIPFSTDSNRYVSAGAFVILLAAFEYEFNRFYSVKHSSKSLQRKNEMKDEITILMENSKGKKKEAYKNIIKHLDDELLEAKIIQINKIYPKGLEQLGKSIYDRNGFKYNMTIIANRIAQQRNDFAHGNIQNEFQQILIVDYLFLEKIVYFIQFINLGLDETKAIEISNRITIG